MKVPRFIGFVDLGIITVILVFAVLPPRERFATPAIDKAKLDETKQFALALAEARVIAQPDDGMAIAAVGRRFSDAGFKDWAIEATLRATERMSANAPLKWRAQLATSVAFVDRLDVQQGLEAANLALGACRGNGTTCPSWEEVRMSLYQQHLKAGVDSGIDPHHDPKGFRAAGEAALRPIHIGKQPSDRAPAP